MFSLPKITWTREKYITFQEYGPIIFEAPRDKNMRNGEKLDFTRIL